MVRPTGIIKRQPEMDHTFLERYSRISKADWADLYFDLYRQLNGEQETDKAIMHDVERRLIILKSYRHV